jgi:malate/lactate dehydrogenase
MDNSSTQIESETGCDPHLYVQKESSREKNKNILLKICLPVVKSILKTKANFSFSAITNPIFVNALTFLSVFHPEFGFDSKTDVFK